MDTPLNLKEAIINLQTYLRALSFADEQLERIAIDGIFDENTERAVAIFQRTRGLPETGIVDKNTWDAIYKEYSELLRQTDRSPSVNFFPKAPENYEAAIGDEHAFISLVQLLLRELSVVFDSFPEIEVNGVFDSATENAVREFQKASGLPITGKVNLLTWNRLVRDFSNYSAF